MYCFLKKQLDEGSRKQKACQEDVKVSLSTACEHWVCLQQEAGGGSGRRKLGGADQLASAVCVIVTSCSRYSIVLVTWLLFIDKP